MAFSNYIKVTIGDYAAQVTDPADLPVSIDYLLEDPQEFQNKKSSQAFDLEIPATLINSVVANTFHNPSIDDLTTGQVFRSKQKGVIESNGQELIVGVAFLKQAAHDSKPQSYTYNILGDNSDWLVDMKDKTLYDFLSDLAFTFDKTTIQNSWNADGVNRAFRYVFAPVRYREPMGGYTIDATNNLLVPNDENALPEYLRPSLFKYFILFDAFKSLGYRIQSAFMDSTYFRRQVMPWIWTNFLDSDGTQLEAHRFLAKSVADKYFEPEKGHPLDEFIDVNVSNDSTLGAYDNNDDYIWDAVDKEMEWTYNTPDFGALSATFSMQVQYVTAVSGSTSNLSLRIDWFINGVLKQEDVIVEANGGIIGTGRPQGIQDVFFNTETYGTTLSTGDVVSAKVHLHIYRDKLYGVCHINVNILSFQLDFFRIPIGGTIDFANYTGLKNFNIVDFISGLIDEFNLSINTDSVNKIVYIEPTHPYSTTNDLSVQNPGYFKEDFVDWNAKADYSKQWVMENYSDSEKELSIAYKDDSNDGILKLIQDRNVTKLASGKYVFPDRFKTGSKTIENRFFSPTMHVFMTQWTALGIGGNTNITPQMICIIPENISNTSKGGADNTFMPKSCYYKGLITGAGAWRFDGTVLQTYPFMFAVNYQNGGAADPILSYSDEKIGVTSFVLGKGLLKRFYWQRFAIMRNGQWYTAWFNLNNTDVAGRLHREYKSLNGQKWELIEIKGYKPLVAESTTCLLYKWSPVIASDLSNTYPTQSSVMDDVISGLLDTKYAQLKCLITDIPT